MLFIPWQHPQIGAMLPLLIPGWTLNYEMAFYVMFAASLCIAASRSACGRCWPCLPGLAALGAAMPLSGILAFYTDPIILEFAAGLLIAKAWTSGVTVPVKAASFVTLLGFALLLAGSETTLPRIVAAGIPAFLIVAGAVFSESRYKLKPSRTLVLLGDASYSIYLSHVIVLPVVAKLWLGIGSRRRWPVRPGIRDRRDGRIGICRRRSLQARRAPAAAMAERQEARQHQATSSARPGAGEAAGQLSNAAILDYKPAPTARASRPGSNSF